MMVLCNNYLEKTRNLMKKDVKALRSKIVLYIKFNHGITSMFLSVNRARLKTGNRFLLHRHISVNKVESKVNKTIGIMRKLRNVLPRSALFTIYKLLIRPRLDYGVFSR